jgi:hypothetical protein
MKSISLKIIILAIVFGTLVNACDKAGTPTPSTSDILPVKTWKLASFQTTVNGPVTNISKGSCSGLVFQFPNSGIYNQGAGCSAPLYTGTWTISDQTVTLTSGLNSKSISTLTISSISSTGMSATLSSSGSQTYIMKFIAQ